MHNDDYCGDDDDDNGDDVDDGAVGDGDDDGDDDIGIMVIGLMVYWFIGLVIACTICIIVYWSIGLSYYQYRYNGILAYSPINVNTLWGARLS